MSCAGRRLSCCPSPRLSATESHKTNYGPRLLGIFHRFPSAHFSHSITNPIGPGVGNHRDVVGRSLSRTLAGLGCEGWPAAAPVHVRIAAADLLFLVVMACCASLAGVAGFFAACSGLIGGRQVLVPSLGQSAYPRFVADWFAHITSYAIGFLGGLVLCVLQYRRRRVLARIETMSGPAVKTLARRN